MQRNGIRKTVTLFQFYSAQNRTTSDQQLFDRPSYIYQRGKKYMKN